MYKFPKCEEKMYLKNLKNEKIFKKYLNNKILIFLAIFEKYV